MNAAIIVDSTAGLSKELANRPDVFQLYLSSIFDDGTVYVDRSDESQTREFYQRMESESELPSTSQPEPQQIYDVLDQIVAEGYDTVFGLFLSSGLSGTYQSVESLSKEYADRLDIHIIDSLLTSFVNDAMVLNMLALSERDLDANEIERQVKDLISQSGFYFTVERLDNLVKGGRVSSLSGLVGNLLNIKPIITLGDHTGGKADASEKVRSKKKAVNRLFEIAVDHIKDYPDHAYIAVGHTGALEDAEALRDRLQAAYPNNTVRLDFITPVLGTHAGKGGVSINVAPLVE